MTLRYRALVERRLSGAPCPGVPVLFWKHHPIVDQDGAALCRSTLDFQDRFDCDLIKISPAATYQLPDYGLRDAWRGDSIGRRDVTQTVIKRPDDWARLPRLDPREGFVARFGECVRMVRREAPPEMPVIITVFDPMFQALTLAGEPVIQEHLRAAPDAVDIGLARITENTVDLIHHLIGQGAEGIFLASQHATRSVFPGPVFDRHGMPGVLTCLEAMAGLQFNMVHVHGAEVHADLFARLSGVTIHYDMWADNSPPQRFLDAGCSVATGPSPALLASEAPDDEVTAACLALLRLGGRTILSPGCSVPLAVSSQRMGLISASARSKYET
jgi:uroporphyrinogen decarboxylase